MHPVQRTKKYQPNQNVRTWITGDKGDVKTLKDIIFRTTLTKIHPEVTVQRYNSESDTIAS